MNLNIPLPADLENQLRRQAAAAGQDVERFVLGVITEAVAEDLVPGPLPDSSKRRTERFRERLEAWTRLHPVLEHPVDDSRESIYAGRGE